MKLPVQRTAPDALEQGDIDNVAFCMVDGVQAVAKRFNAEDPYGVDRYEREKALLTLFSQQGLAPRVLEADDEAHMLAIEYIVPRTARALGSIALGTPQNIDIWKELPAIAKAMTQMHAEPLENLPGILRRSALLDHGKMARYACELTAPILAYAADRPAGINQPVASQIHEWVEEIVTVLEAYEPAGKTFLHGDLHIKNILLPDNGVRFIDFGKARIGDPAYDIAYFSARSASARFLDMNPSSGLQFMGVTIREYAKVTGRPIEPLAAATWCNYLYDMLDQFTLANNMSLIRPSSRPLFYRTLNANLAAMERLSTNKFQLTPALGVL